MRHWGILFGVLLYIAPLTASGTGLVRDGVELLAPGSLEITATIISDTATVQTTRSYNVNLVGEAPDGEPVLSEYRFYRSIPGGNAASEVTLTVNSVAVGGTLYTGEEADARRRSLVLSLRSPAPLKHQGQPLFVSDPLSDAALADVYGLTITAKVTLPMRAHGTLMGVATPVDWHSSPVNQLNVTTTASMDGQLRALYSPYHPLTVSRVTAKTSSGAFSGWNHTTAFDVTILTSVGSDPMHLDILPFRYDDDEGGHFMALLTPDAEPGENAVVPRDISIVLDQSGSMQGEKLGQAKVALKEVLNGLRGQDNFALSSFANSVAQLNDAAVPAGAENRTAAKEFVDAIDADGGTNLHDALKAGIKALPLNKGNPRYVVLLTDGIPTDGITDTEEILEMARTVNEVGARIVIFGIGDDVNTVLLEKLAKESGGAVYFIRFGMSVELAVTSFFETLQAPMMADPELDLSAFGAAAMYPEKLPDLFAGQTVALLGRFSTPGAGTVTLSGMANGAAVEHVYDVTLPSYNIGAGYVPKIWATRHIGTLLHRIKLEGKNPDLVDDALATARRYGIVTQFTYYSVDEDGNSAMTYSEVPMDSVGDKAVATSAALDEYESDDALRTQSLADARWWRDRVFPLRGGWFTDTYPKETPQWIDVHFGSDQYFDLAADEAAHGVGGFLAVARNVRFELLGRTFRITDPQEPPVEALPVETEVIPAPLQTPTDVLVAVSYTGETPADQLEPPLVQGEEVGCTSSGAPAPGALALFLLALLGLIGRRIVLATGR